MKYHMQSLPQLFFSNKILQTPDLFSMLPSLLTWLQLAVTPVERVTRQSDLTLNTLNTTTPTPSLISLSWRHVSDTQLKQDSPWDALYYYIYRLYYCVHYVELSILSLNCITEDKGPCEIVACVTVSVVTGIGSVVSWGQSLRGMGTHIRARPSPSDISERLVDQYFV